MAAPPQGLHETCDTVGIIAPAVAWASAIQVTEALKILLGRERDLGVQRPGRHGALTSR